MAPASVTLDAVLVGAVALLPDGKTPSAMAKRPVDGPRQVGPVGFVDDAQADLTVHGGTDKAILHYSADHYPAWAADYGDGLPETLAAPGAFGENLSSPGWTEDTVHLGDVIRIGTVLVEVTQARQPCFKLNVRHGLADLSYRVLKTGRSGWYYRVKETGAIAAGDTATLVDRLHPDWPVRRGFQVLMGNARDREALAALGALPCLADAWKSQVARRLAE